MFGIKKKSKKTPVSPKPKRKSIKLTKYVVTKRLRADIGGHEIVAEKDDIIPLNQNEANILKDLIKEV